MKNDGICLRCGSATRKRSRRYCSQDCYHESKRVAPRDRILSGFVEDANGCWIWQGYITEKGYGSIGIARRKWQAHRAAYEYLVGPVPDGLELDHICRVRACVNPAHLEPVTRAENIHRGLLGVLRTHCPHGHEFTPQNTYGDYGNRRRCRLCEQRRNRRNYVARRKRILEAGGQ